MQGKEQSTNIKTDICNNAVNIIDICIYEGIMQMSKGGGGIEIFEDDKRKTRNITEKSRPKTWRR